MERIDVVLGADNFGQRLALGTRVSLHCVPWRGESARIFDMDLHLEHLAALDHAEALDDMEFVGVRRAVIVDERPRRDADGIHDHRVSPS